MVENAQIGDQQRRLTTILAADVVNYSGLMARDEKATLSRLKQYRRVFEDMFGRHGGRLFNTAGDSILAEFGSAVEAVRCAIAIQDELRLLNSASDAEGQMQFRIGVNIGDVLVEDGNLYGDGVNVAARLESLAEPGGICTAASVVELVKSKVSFAFEDLGPQTVKNIPEPIRAYKMATADASGQAPNGERRTQQRPKRRKYYGVGGLVALGVVVVSAAVVALTAPGWLGLSDTSELSNAQAKRLKPYIGMTAHGKTTDGSPLSIHLNKDGVAKVTWRLARGGEIAKDNGRWWISKKGHLCVEFTYFSQGRAFCRTLRYVSGQLRAISFSKAFPDWVLIAR